MFVKFWVKTALHRFTPGGYGYYRHVRRHRDPGYEHARDQHSVRRRHNASSGWGETDEGGLRMRSYATYDEYVVHQQQKLDEMVKLAGGLDNRVVTQYRLKFHRRFKHLVGRVPPSATIVCLGARLGTEVEVLRDLGFANAYGIDVNPGPENPYVRFGDFNDLKIPDATVDLVYTNCVDHAFDLDAFFAEHARVLKADGYALYDLPEANADSTAPFESIVWESDAVVLRRLLPRFREIAHRERDGAWEWLLLQGPLPPASG